MVSSSRIVTKDMTTTHPQAAIDPHYVATGPARMSEPVSFLSASRFRLAVTLILSLAICFMGSHVVDAQVYATAQNPFNSTGCVCNFTADYDYFPLKLAQTYSDKFVIEYHKSYKKITVTDVAGLPDMVYYLVLCGTPVPDVAKPGLNSTDRTIQTVEIPIRTTGIMSSTFFPFIELLGQRPSVQVLNYGYPAGMNACQNKLYDEGLLFTDAYDPEVYSAIQESSIERTGSEIDVYFTDSYNLDYIFPSIGGTSAAVVLVGDTQETNPLAIVEWIEFYAAFYNIEAAAKDVANDIYLRYLCSKELVDKAKVLGVIPNTPKKVFWGSARVNETSMEVIYTQGLCEQWYCGIIRDAGGVMVPQVDGVTYTFQDAFNEADVFIFAGDNFNLPGTWYNIPYLYHNGNDNDTNVFVNKKVFDIRGQNYNEYFETVKQQPDVFLLDMFQAMYGDVVVPGRSRFILRNPWLEASAPQGPRPASGCQDAAAPRDDSNHLIPQCSQGSSTLAKNNVFGQVRPPNDQCMVESGSPNATVAPTSAGARVAPSMLNLVVLVYAFIAFVLA